MIAYFLGRKVNRGGVLLQIYRNNFLKFLLYSAVALQSVLLPFEYYLGNGVNLWPTVAYLICIFSAIYLIHKYPNTEIAKYLFLVSLAFISITLYNKDIERNYIEIFAFAFPTTAFLLYGKNKGLVFSILLGIFVYIKSYVIQQDLLNPAHSTLVIIRMTSLYILIIGLNYFIYSMFFKILHRTESIAYRDHLTNLPNRNKLIDDLRVVLHTKSQKELSIIVIDIDEFKLFNNLFGEEKSNQLLKLFAKNLKSFTSECIFFARLYGDEFCLVVKETNSEFLEAICKKINEIVNVSSIEVTGSYQLSASFGISQFPKHGSDVYRLFQAATIAKTEAKSLGYSQRVTFQPDLKVSLEKEIAIERWLTTAVKNNDLEMFYQPIFSLENDCIVGCESLLRVRNKIWHKLSIEHIISIAERSRMIEGLGEWVIQEAVQTHRVILSHANQPLTNAINISPQQFYQADFYESIRDCLAENDVLPENLVLELTEGLLINDDQKVLKQLLRFKDLGISLSLDDFGTGYSSLSYLKKFPFDIIKIDRSFIQTIGKKDEEIHLVKAIINMAKSLNMEILAEGVETKYQYNLLKELGCDKVQGWFFSRALSLNDILAFLSNEEIKNVSSRHKVRELEYLERDSLSRLG